MQKTRLLLHHQQSWKFLVLAAALVLACLVLFTYSTTAGRVPSQLQPPGNSGTSSPGGSAQNGDSDSDSKSEGSTKPNTDIVNACSIDLDTLYLYADNSSTIDYARIIVGVNRTEHFTSITDSLDVSIPSYRTINLESDASENLRPETDDDCAPSAIIAAPLAVPQLDASHMIFGVATTLEKLEESLDGFAHWAGNTGAKIIAVVEQGGSFTRSRIKDRASELGIKLTITQTEDDRFDRYFSLIRVLYQAIKDSGAESIAKWAVLIDDDTFFPSMRNLVSRFEGYDASVPQYIGGMTEDMARLSKSGYMAYGGAGIFLSIPLLSDLQYVFETCHSFKDKGDRMLASCIYAHTNTKFTWERGLYQLDLHGDVSGFFESGRDLPLSVHHFNSPSWFEVDMGSLSKVASICGDECLLHRFHLSKSKDWFLINGFSVIGDKTIWNDPRPMEQTWQKSEYKGEDPFAYSLGPLRRVDKDKVSMRLKGVVGDEQERGKEERVRQLYVLDGTEEKAPKVLEVVWTLVDGAIDS